MADTTGSNGDRKEFFAVGKPNVPGKVSHSLATGSAKFGTDVIVPNMLHAKFLRSPHARAQVKSIDTSKAKALPGVVEIITWDDPEIKALGGGAGIGGAGGGGMIDEMGAPMLDDIADMEDQEVGAIVVAESEDLCDEALRLLKIEWDVQPHILDPREGKKPGAPILRLNAKGEKTNVEVAKRNDGDIEAGFKQADQIIEFDWNLPYFSSHIPNPAGGVAWWYTDPWHSEGQSLWIEGAMQGRSHIANLYKLPQDKVTENTLFQGGKYCDWGLRKAVMVTPFLARRTGRPVRMTSTRQNMYDLAINQRYGHMKVGFKNDGTITAVQDTSVAAAGIRYSTNFGTVMDMRYGPFPTTKCPNLQIICEAVNTNTGKLYLSAQHCPYTWDTMTVAMQRIADKLGMDPIDIATKNIHGPSSPTDTSIPPSYQACVEKGRNEMNWKWHAPGAKKLPDGRMHGASFRYQMCPRHAFSSYACTVAVKDDGKVYLPTRGPVTGMFAIDAIALVVAEEMGARIEDVIVEFDPRASFTPVGGGSDGTTAAAWVAKEAAVACRKLLLETAAGGLRAKPEDLDIKDSKVFLKSNPGKGFQYSQFSGRDVAVTFTGKPPLSLWSLGMGKMLDTMNALFSEVAVDTETGEVEVLRHLIVADPGKVLRPTSLEGQLHQVMMFSEGTQLKEEFVFDQKTGVKLHTNMFEYRKPTIVDIGKVESHLLETRAGNAAYGANGISHSLANTHAIICAIQNAIDKWVDPPATPDKILKALGKA
jgi:CO/xanthine dehydrogenase Mo-binding subunit